MSGVPHIKHRWPGYCLVELTIVVSLLTMLVVIGLTCFTGNLSRQRARASAQATQAAVAWAQSDTLWCGGGAQVVCGGPELVVRSTTEGAGGELSFLAPPSEVTANVSRWNRADGILLGIVAPFASPDAGGSLYFESGHGAYRVVVRPESGLTVRSLETP